MSKQIDLDESAASTAVMDLAQEAAPNRTPPKKAAAPTPATTEPARPISPVRKRRAVAVAAPVRHFSANHFDDDSSNRQAELFYLQKQIQQQTPMVFILEDGERIQGVVEWYDRHSIKVRGKSRVLIYKTAIKYLYKAGDNGSTPEK